MAQGPFADPAVHHKEGAPKKLVLCFDGTSNKFSGEKSDTNIVKLYEMLNRDASDQYHYYQPGIGTYSAEAFTSSNRTLLSKVRQYISSSLDAMFATTFTSHVLAGYQFLMRYWAPGDKVYIFGFSRGAYTARFLSEMLQIIGLLSRGNEELVRFAWEAFAEYQEDLNRTTKDPKVQFYRDRFRDTYCRKEFHVYFLGLFDCVSSVQQFRVPIFGSKPCPQIPTNPASYIRHAVSIHERRLKFKPALFSMNGDFDHGNVELWFAGNHGDIGGGWDVGGPGKDLLPKDVLLSDIALKWMIDEIIALEASHPHPAGPLRWDEDKRKVLEDEQKALEPYLLPEEGKDALGGKWVSTLPHDPLAFGRGLSWWKVLGWWLIEILPFARYELINGHWVSKSFPPNYGAGRDIPKNKDPKRLVFHPSVAKLARAGVIRDDYQKMLGGHETKKTHAHESPAAPVQTNGT